jgi:alcohol dehydrogenase class IV
VNTVVTTETMGLEPFTWRDGERTIRFGRGVLRDAVDVLGGPGYLLLTTERAAQTAPHVVDAAAAVEHVRAGRVDEIAGELRERLGPAPAERLVALGGGRAIDVVKALAAGSGGTARALAVPTTLSGAEMTAIHRPAAGVPSGTPTVRCAVVVNDPALSASQPDPALAASTLNALGHAAEAPCTPLANPVATLAAHRAARLLATAWPAVREPGTAPGAPDRDALGLGSLLAGYSIDSAHYGLHHVLSQTLVREAGAGHGPANAAMLPHSLGALAWRFPRQHEQLAAVFMEDPLAVIGRLTTLATATRLRDIGVEAGVLAHCADVAAQRAELDNTAPRADRAELLALYEAAW